MFFDLNIGNLAEPLSGRAWQRQDILEQVGRRVARFRRLGLTRGDRVFLPFGNKLEFFAELLAAWKLGACAVPIDARLTAFEIRTLVEAALPKIAVIDEKTDAVIRDAARIGHQFSKPPTSHAKSDDDEDHFPIHVVCSFT